MRAVGWRTAEGDSSPHASTFICCRQGRQTRTFPTPASPRDEYAASTGPQCRCRHIDSTRFSLRLSACLPRYMSVPLLSLSFSVSRSLSLPETYAVRVCVFLLSILSVWLLRDLSFPLLNRCSSTKKPILHHKVADKVIGEAHRISVDRSDTKRRRGREGWQTGQKQQTQHGRPAAEGPHS